MSNNIFYIEWEGKYSSRQYRLEIYKASADIMSAPTYRKIDGLCLSLPKFEWKFKDLPLGAMSEIDLSAEWQIDAINVVRLHGEDASIPLALRAEFINMLKNPIVELELYPGSNIKFKSGNVYSLSIDNMVIYQGVQLSDFAFGFDGTTSFKVEIKSLAKYALTAFDFKQWISYIDWIGYRVDEVIHYLELMSGSHRCIKEVAYDKRDIDKHHFQMVSIELLYNELRNAISRTIALLTRRSPDSVNIQIELKLMNYYKRNHYYQTKGDKVSFGDFTVPGIIKRKGEVVGGLFSPQNEDSLSRYATIYDFLSDWAESELKKLVLSPTGDSIKMLPMFNSNPTLITLDTKYITLKECRLFSVEQLTISLEEFGTNDVDNYRFNAGVPCNASEIQMPLLWNNTPSANSYKKESGTGGGTNITVGPVRQFNLYYNNTIESGWGFDSTFKAFSVHSHVNVALAERWDHTLGKLEEKAVLGNDIVGLSLDVDNAQRYCLAVQKEKGKPLVFEKLIDYIKKGYSLKISYPLMTGHSLNDFLDGANNTFRFELTDFNEMFDGFPNEYYITGFSYNIAEEALELQFFASDKTIE